MRKVCYSVLLRTQPISETPKASDTPIRSTLVIRKDLPHRRMGFHQWCRCWRRDDIYRPVPLGKHREQWGREHDIPQESSLDNDGAASGGGGDVRHDERGI